MWSRVRGCIHGNSGESHGGAAHQWRSPEYVRQWVTDNESRAKERRQQGDRLADYVASPAGAAISVLDLGAGWGPVTRRVLDRFPNARSTLLDYSEQMFAEARQHLQAHGNRVLIGGHVEKL